MGLFMIMKEWLNCSMTSLLMWEKNLADAIKPIESQQSQSISSAPSSLKSFYISPTTEDEFAASISSLSNKKAKRGEDIDTFYAELGSTAAQK